MIRISKPHIVDLLRIFDRKKWIRPRIRYASVRSKPELIADLSRHFIVRHEGDRLYFFPKKVNHGSELPKIEYDLLQKRYYLDGIHVDVPKESRNRPKFSISRVPVTLDFSEFFVGQTAEQSPPSTRRASVSSEGSLELGTHSPRDGLARTGPSSPSGCTPTSKPACRSASAERTRAGNPSYVLRV